MYSPYTFFKKIKHTKHPHKVGDYRVTVEVSLDERVAATYLCQKNHDPSEVLVNIYKSHLTRRQMNCLRPGQLLEGFVISAWVDMLVLEEKRKLDTAKITWFLSTTFMPGVLSNQNNLLGYALRQDIIGAYMYDVFRVDKVMIPMHDDSPEHWYLLYMDMPNLICQVWDTCSNAKHRYAREMKCRLMLEALDKILCDDALVYITPTFNFAKLNVTTRSRVVQQGNGFDCGVFIMKFMADQDSVSLAAVKHNSYNDRFNIACQLLLSEDNAARDTFMPLAHKAVLGKVPVDEAGGHLFPAVHINDRTLTFKEPNN